jgi:hypothetical protein
VFPSTPDQPWLAAPCNAKPGIGTLKVYLNVPQSSAERLQRTLFVLRVSPE